MWKDEAWLCPFTGNWPSSLYLYVINWCRFDSIQIFFVGKGGEMSKDKQRGKLINWVLQNSKLSHWSTDCDWLTKVKWIYEPSCLLAHGIVEGIKSWTTWYGCAISYAALSLLSELSHLNPSPQLIRKRLFLKEELWEWKLFCVQ